jgi:hypothetical protein
LIVASAWVMRCRRIPVIPGSPSPPTPLCITTKTVKDHLGSAYGKLQITYRAELAEALTGDDG